MPIGIVLFTILLLWLALERHQFDFIYPLDDAYIHLAIAKNLILHGNWGMSPDQFHFSSSSPGYTLLLALGYGITGTNVWMPLLINGLVAVATWIWIYRIFPARKSIWTGVIFFLAPVPLLFLCGMEHLIQCSVCMLLLWKTTEYLDKETNNPWQILVFAFLAVLFRYEGLFLIVAISVLAILLQKKKFAALLMLAGTMPVLISGGLSLYAGGTFLPLSIWMKGHSPGVSVSELGQWLATGIGRLYDNPFILVLGIALLILAGAAAHRHKNWKNATTICCSIVLLNLIIHALFAEIGGYRYEAYLICMGILCIAQGVERNNFFDLFRLTVPSRFFILGAVALLLFPLLVRVVFFYINYPLATQNIYHQHIQMAKFLQQYDSDSRIAVNDIGAVSFFTKVQLLDLLGIANEEVASLRKQNQYSANEVLRISTQQKIRLAVVHEEWVGIYLPENWQKIASWTIPDNFICAFETVSWYAVNPEETERLRQALKEFEPSLPKGISVEYH